MSRRSRWLFRWNRYATLLVFCGTLGPSLAAQSVSLDGDWRFWTGPDSYVPIAVPFSITPRNTLSGYEKVFTLPPGTLADLIVLQFDGVVGQTTVYLNGVKLGTHGSYTPFWFDVSGVIDRTGQNDLIVTIDDRQDVTTVPYSDIPWVNFSGISRSVHLECTDGVLLLAAEPQYTLSADLKHVDGQVEVHAVGAAGTIVYVQGALLDGNPGQWTTVSSLGPSVPMLVGPDGLISTTLTFAFDDPVLWSPESPHLYSLYVVALANGQPQSDRLLQTGFRDVRVQGTDILLNGRPVLLRGMSRHDIYPGTGYVGTEAQMVDDMLRIKSAGCNYVRLIHYPQHPRILELADQLGLLVSEEVPAWANFWDPSVRQQLYGMLAETIHRDMHHPSIFLWISGNARAYPMPYAQEAQQLIKSLDRNRLGSYVIDNDQYDPATIADDVAFYQQAGLDLYMKITWWFYYLEYLQDAWTNFPKDIPILIAEFGREGDSREPIVVDGTQTYWWGEDQQASAISQMLEAWRPHLPQYDANAHIAGLCLFNYQDTAWPDIDRYLPNHVPSLHWGVVYEDRTPKQVLATVTDFYANLPTEFVGLPTTEPGTVERLFHNPTDAGSVLNGPNRDSGPSLSADGRTLYFVSDGPGYVGLPKIFTSNRQDGQWSAPQLLDIPQETEPFAFRASPCISYDGQTLYFTRAVVSGIYVARTRIWASHRLSGGWSAPEDLGDVVNFPDASRVTSDPSISADGHTLFFSSDRPGGYGQTDLWMSRTVDGVWTEPMNLGPDINSASNDAEPSITPDGRTLYFTSDRPGGVGSADIWVSHFDGNAWSKPKNLGPDLNSPGADREPEISKNGRTLMFTGIRAGGHGLSDLWEARTIFGLGDLNRDGVVDAQDLSRLSTCETGAAVAQPDPSCLDADLDGDGDVDLDDFGILQRCFSSTGETPPPGCQD